MCPGPGLFLRLFLGILVKTQGSKKKNPICEQQHGAGFCIPSLFSVQGFKAFLTERVLFVGDVWGRCPVEAPPDHSLLISQPH